MERLYENEDQIHLYRPRLQYLPSHVLRLILEQLDHQARKHLFHGASRRLTTLTRLVMIEQLALGINLYGGVVGVDRDQLGRQIAVCQSINAAQWTEERRRSLCEVRGKRSEHPRKNPVGRTLAKDKARSEQKDQISVPSGGLPVHSSIWKFPDEILLQILKEQPTSTLKSSQKSGSAQLRRVAETLLFERRRAFFEARNIRSRPNNTTDEQVCWPPVSEVGECYAGKIFLLVNDGVTNNCVDGLRAVGSTYQHRKLGSYWSIICTSYGGCVS